MEQLLSFDTFRPDLPKAVSIRDVWPLLLLVCGVMFLADVFVRRVALTLDWVVPSLRWLKNKLLSRRVVVEVEQRLERLRSKKQELAQSIDQRRAATRFSPQEEQADVTAPDVDTVLKDLQSAASAADRSPRPAAPAQRDQSDTDAYTARLLEAKKKAREEQERKHKK